MLLIITFNYDGSTRIMNTQAQVAIFMDNIKRFVLKFSLEIVKRNMLRPFFLLSYTRRNWGQSDLRHVLWQHICKSGFIHVKVAALLQVLSFHKHFISNNIYFMWFNEACGW
jgi:hypothetical protein